MEGFKLKDVPTEGAGGLIDSGPGGLSEGVGLGVGSESVSIFVLRPIYSTE